MSEKIDVTLRTTQYRKIERMNHIRYELCNDVDEYMDLLDEFVDLAIEVNDSIYPRGYQAFIGDEK